jgi:hypothetical protein
LLPLLLLLEFPELLPLPLLLIPPPLLLLPETTVGSYGVAKIYL